MAPENKAAWLVASNTPLEVGPAPYTLPGPHELVIKNGAVAINPVDWVIPDRRSMMFKWIKDPFIIGTDVAETVIETGSLITRFKPGDRVVAIATGINEDVNQAAKGAFQLYTVLEEHMTALIPDSVSFEQACVIPLGLCTAACGLFQTDQLHLQLPTEPRNNSTGKTVIIWGGATSVGCNAIQLAVAAGYEVFSTCSPANFPLLRKLGAAQVWDYRSPTIVQDMIAAFNGSNKICAGALTMGSGSVEACLAILRAVKGDKFISMASYPLPDPEPTSFVLPRTVFFILRKNLEYAVKSWLWGIKMGTIFGSTLVRNGVGKSVWEGYLGDALQRGVEGKGDGFVCAPEAMVMGTGLESVWTGFEKQKKGVKAKKVVVSLG